VRNDVAIKGQPSPQSSSLPEPTYLRWQDYRRSFKWRTAQGKSWGANLLEYPPVEGPSFSSRLFMLPVAQTISEERDTGDVVFLGIEGDVEFNVGSEPVLLKPLDLLSVPANTVYTYVNIGLTDALMCGVFAKNDAPQSASTQPTGKPQHMIWNDYRRDFHWTLPLAERWGYHRGSGPLIIAEMLRGHTARMPTAQTTPWHFSPRDMLFMGIRNEVEFAAAARKWPLGRFDFLLLPAGTPFIYTNFGLDEALFFSIGGELPPGRKGSYFAEDPGWPIRADARTLDVEIDPYGDARIKERYAPNR
jgi:quercetin dioxygenase-like cupin family protein